MALYDSQMSQDSHLPLPSRWTEMRLSAGVTGHVLQEPTLPARSPTSADEPNQTFGPDGLALGQRIEFTVNAHLARMEAAK